MSEYGPFATEEDAWSTEAFAAERAAWEANPVPGNSEKFNLKMLLHDIEKIGVELGAYDLSPLRQVAMYETQKCVALRGIIHRAYEAGLTARDRAADVEWGVRSRPDKEPWGHVSEHAAEGEAAARKTVATMREKLPEWNAALIVRTPERPAGPWKLAPEGEAADD